MKPPYQNVNKWPGKKENYLSLIYLADIPVKTSENEGDSHQEVIIDVSKRKFRDRSIDNDNCSRFKDVSETQVASKL